ncbi:MAG: hypothetical protein AB7V45_12940 [Candidatus Krumholzibacteriia bacterium]
MRPDPNGFSVVLVGSWNKAIFSPAWLKAQLGVTTDIGIEFAVGHPTMPTRLVFENVALQVNDNRLVVAPLTLDNDNLSKVESICIKLLETLCHTPLSAVGVNFMYVEERPSRELLAFFDGEDMNILSDAGAVVGSSVIQRNVRYEDYTIHIKSILDERGAIRFDFNFHNNVSTGAAARAAIADKVAPMHTLALGLLGRYPGVTMGEDND